MLKRVKLSSIYLFFRIFISFLLVISVLGVFINTEDDAISRNIFVAMQSLILLVLSFSPSYAEKKFKLQIPNFMESIFLIFIIAALLLGEIAEFFVHISWWDSLLHTASGLLVAIVAFSIIKAAVNNPNKKIDINPLFIAIFVLSFTITVEVVWEIFEYAVDSFVPTSNMLRTKNSLTLEPYEGLYAIRDTMHDIILTFIAASIIATFGFFDSKYKLGIFNRWIITRKEE
ncbi:MAG: hypothetical protein AB7V16_13910 [Vulcanibacillus sp.]